MSTEGPGGREGGPALWRRVPRPPRAAAWKPWVTAENSAAGIRSVWWLCVCTCAGVRVCAHACVVVLSECVYVHASVCSPRCAHCGRVHFCMCVCVYTLMHMSVTVCFYVHVSLCLCAHVCMGVCCVSACTCVHTCTCAEAWQEQAGRSRGCVGTAVWGAKPGSSQDLTQGAPAGKLCQAG